MISKEDKGDVRRAFGSKAASAVASATNDGFDGNKRWGNSAVRGHGVNSSAMMNARKGFNDAKNKAIHAKITLKKGTGKPGSMEYRATGLSNTRKLLDY